MIGENYVSVPTHFFKVVVGEMEDSTLELEAYVLPNQASIVGMAPYYISSFAGILYSRVGQILTFFKIQESGICDWIRVKILRIK